MDILAIYQSAHSQQHSIGHSALCQTNQINGKKVSSFRLKNFLSKKKLALKPTLLNFSTGSQDQVITMFKEMYSILLCKCILLFWDHLQCNFIRLDMLKEVLKITNIINLLKKKKEYKLPSTPNIHIYIQKNFNFFYLNFNFNSYYYNKILKYLIQLKKNSIKMIFAIYIYLAKFILIEFFFYKSDQISSFYFHFAIDKKLFSNWK